MGRSGNEQGASTSANIESLEVTEEDEDEEDFEIPPLSSYVTAWRFWCTFAVWPVLFLVVNVVAFSTLLVFDNKQYSHFGSPKEQSAQRIAMFQTNTAMTSIILLFDFAIILKAAYYMERELQALDTLEEDTTVAGHHTNHVHAQALRKMDRFVQKQRRPRVSPGVSLLYIVAVLCGAGSLSCLGLRGYAASSKMKRDCAIVEPGDPSNPKTDKQIDGLPDELQEWARRWNDHRDSTYPTFIQLNDGRVFFSGQEKTMEKSQLYMSDDYIFYEDDSIMYDIPNTLISTATNDTIQNHFNVMNPRSFTSVKGNSETESQTFCCGYERRTDNEGIRGDRPRRILCVDSGEDVSDGFRNIRQPTRSRDLGYRTDRETKWRAYDGALYLEYTTYEYNHRYDQKLFARMDIYKLQPDSMKLESIANVTGEEHIGTLISGDDSSSACKIWIDAISMSLAAIVVFPASYWLLKKKKNPSGSALAILMLFEILGLVANEEFATAVGFVAAVAASICLFGIVKIPPRMSHEIVVWVFYAIICYFSVSAWNHQTASQREYHHFGYDMHAHRSMMPWWSFVVLGSTVGVLLNHPSLQILGWIGGTAMVFYGLFGSLVEFGWMRSLYDDDGFSPYRPKKNDLWMLPAGLVIGCGLVALGHALTKYRRFVVYYLKRLLRATTNATSVSRGGDDMTTELLTRPEV